MHCNGNTAELPAFMRQQYAFAARIRDPHHTPLPAGVPPRCMAAYEELFFNNIADALGNAFPVLRAIHDDASWQALLRDFFSGHRSRTPLFHRLPREFLRYLEEERGASEGDFPFLQELAHYEWIELELLTSEEEIPALAVGDDLLDAAPVISPLARLLSYRYPVHRIGPAFLPQQPEEPPTHLLVWRDRSDTVGFLELSPVTARLLQRSIACPGASGREQLEAIAIELDHPNPQTVVDGGCAILSELSERGILFGGIGAKGEAR